MRGFLHARSRFIFGTHKKMESETGREKECVVLGKKVMSILMTQGVFLGYVLGFI